MIVLRILFSIFIIFGNTYISRIFQNNKTSNSYFILAYFILFIAVTGLYMKTIVNQVRQEIGAQKSEEIIQRIIDEKYLKTLFVFILITMLYVVVIAFFRGLKSFLKSKETKWEFKNPEKYSNSRLESENKNPIAYIENKNNTLLRNDSLYFFLQMLINQYPQFVHFVRFDLSFYLIATFQLALIWYPELVIKIGEYLNISTELPMFIKTPSLQNWGLVIFTTLRIYKANHWSVLFLF